MLLYIDLQFIEFSLSPLIQSMSQESLYVIFSVTRRSRSDGSESLSESWLADLTDVTLVSDDTFSKLY